MSTSERDAAYLSKRVREMVQVINPAAMEGLIDGFAADAPRRDATSILANMNLAMVEANEEVGWYRCNHRRYLGERTLTITGSPTGGTFTLSGTHPVTGLAFITGSIARNATAAAVQAALEAVVGTGDAEATGGPLPTSSITLVFGKTTLATGKLNGYTTMTATSALTGGTAPAVTVAASYPSEYALPLGVGGIVWVKLVDPVNTARTYPLGYVEVGDLEDYEEGWRDRSARRPEGYYRDSDLLGLVDAPDKSYEMTIRAVTPPPDMVLRTDTPPKLREGYQEIVAIRAALRVSLMQSANEAARVRATGYMEKDRDLTDRLKKTVTVPTLRPPSRRGVVDASGDNWRRGGRGGGTFGRGR